ncbi:STAS domain-containing protein [Streptomyces griseorubiginosus]|uniref:STAS domain-containing protein n=1 Tax=Streptomyces griseorubiginosus TaxID=67304 RepID=UPI00076BEB8F|nr:STAS domain-containing protein [Streptomyces griseorubiginosus]KUM81615.1 anti-anti-sigma factor [Streptomyces griseorubiginosus]
MSTADDSQNPFGQVNGHVPEENGLVQYERDKAWVIVAHGAFDMDTIAPLTEALQAAVAEHARVVVDVSGITFADSTFLNLLLHINQQTDLRIVAPAPQLRRVLEMTGADTVLTVQPTVDDAAR